MIFVEIIYIITALVALSACLPQIKKLLVAKRSDEFSLQTWSIWTMTQLATLVYVMSLGEVLMILVNLSWVSFYAFMVVLIVRYRRPGVPALAPERVE